MPDPRVPRMLPADHGERRALHDEVHARPPARVRLPALITHVAVLNAEVSRETEGEHLARLPGQAPIDAERLRSNFLRLRLAGGLLKWERHSEFTRYTLVQTGPAEIDFAVPDAALDGGDRIPRSWWAALPGRTIAAVQIVMLPRPLTDPASLVEPARAWFGGGSLVASQTGRGHSVALTDFRLRDDGFERMLLVLPPDTSETRAGRVAGRLLDLETYRLMALRGLPLAKSLGPLLAESEASLADITVRLEAKRDRDDELLDRLVALAARVERATAEHSYRFEATRAYHAIVEQRIAELRELPIPGTQTIGEFMQRRLSPAMATVDATARRLAALSQRVERAGALLRTRVDIATETQNQQLLAKLTRGQELQLKLQATVEGLSIAAISYYVVSLLLYAAKAAKAAGLPIHPELAAGASIPFVLWGVTWLTRRIHARLSA